MRTTVTLDADVEQLLRDAMQHRRQSFKEALNQAIRSGLSNAQSGAEDTSFIVRARRMGLRAGIDSARLNQISDELEAESFDELSGRLAKSHGKSHSRKRS
ncbi:MAG: antitoxin [Steroidobacteraceae bacterium]